MKRFWNCLIGVVMIVLFVTTWHFWPKITATWHFWPLTADAAKKVEVKKITPMTAEESAVAYKDRVAKEYAQLETLQEEMYAKKEAYLRIQLENSVPKNLLEEKVQEAVLAAKKKWNFEHMEELAKFTADKAALASAKRDLLAQEKAVAVAKKALEKDKESFKPDAANEVMKSLIRKHFEMEEMIKDYLLKIEMAPPVQKSALRAKMAAEQRARFGEIQALLNSLRPGVMAEVPNPLPKKR